LVGLVAPHAGLQYSGGVAAHAFKCAQGLSVDVVALLCPSHYVDHAPLLTTTHSASRTPLGDVEVTGETEAVVGYGAVMLWK